MFIHCVPSENVCVCVPVLVEAVVGLIDIDFLVALSRGVGVGACMCGCMHVWVRACVGACMCGCLYVWVHACVGACMCGCVHVWVRVCVGACMCGCVHVWVHACVGGCVHVLSNLRLKRSTKQLYKLDDLLQH